MKKQLTAAEQYLAQRKDAPRNLVDVTVPSGAVFVFEKPSKFGLLFGMGQLPQFASSEAVGKWTEDGIAKGVESGDADTLKMVDVAFATRDRVLQLSYSPKLVVGKANPAKNELSTDDVSDEDLTYLFKWVQAGGDASLMLRTFPDGSQSGSMAGANRTARRAAAKRNGRA